MTYFILGSHPELSIAEIEAVIGKKPIVAQSETVLILDEVDENLSVLQERLAGTIKIGRVIGELNEWNGQDAVDLIAMNVMEAAGKNKISYGLSMYDMGDHVLIKTLVDSLKVIGLKIKKQVKESGRPVRYVSSKESALSSVIVEENDLLASGGEYVLLARPGGVLIGQTESVQPYRAWSLRDYGRPARNAKAGMLPPKLARMMINLSGVPSEGNTILDPFCGSGTILMEAQLMGFERLIGSDISEKAVEDTATNLTWLVDQLKLKPPSLALHVSSAQEIHSVIQKPVDLIVTETFLGEPRTKPLTDEQFGTAKKELMKIYDPAFQKLFTLLKPNGVMVLALPAFKVGTHYKRLALESFFEKIGFRVNQSFLYHRPDQIVGREILFLKK